jgi:hypothetical protein
MAKKRRGFSGLMVLDSGRDSLAEMRRGIRRDIRRAMDEVDTDGKKEDKHISDILQAFSSMQAWQVMQTAQTNITNRMAQLSQFVEQSGPNAGRIVIPTNWDSRARQLLGTVLEGYVGLSIDTYNAFSADKALTLWGFLMNSFGMGGLGDSVFGTIMLLQFTGMGLGTQGFLNLPNMNVQAALLVPRLVTTQIAAIP